MFIVIPTEVLPSKKNIPWLTIVLAIALIFSFIVFQSDDEKKLNNAIQFYQASDLFTEEVELFKRYKNTEQGLNRYTDLSIVDLEGPSRIYLMILDPGFRHYVALHQSENQNENPDNYLKWQSFNKQLDYLVNQISYVQYGASPQNQSVLTLITYQFLHSGWPHLLGNLLFLFIFSTGVELLYGRITTVCLFISTGIFGGLLFNVLAGTAFTPLIGASASISGLMAAYAVYFGSKKINFFAWLGVYFNHYQWPAFVVLLFWLLKELIFQVVDSESGIAYLAHFGGLCSGALLGLTIKYLLPFILRTKIETNLNTNQNDNSHEGSTQQQSKLKSLELFQSAQEKIRTLDFNRAKNDLKLSLKLNPNNLKAAESLYHIVKLQPQSEDFKFSLNSIFEQPLKFEQWDSFCLKVSNQHTTDIRIERLSIDSFFNLLQRQLRNDQVDLNKAKVEQAKKYYAQQEQLPQLLFQWSMALAKRNRLRTAVKELNYLANYYGETSYGQAAIEQLKRLKG
ncbi:MAG: rhomboid family intramembrane serine protease [Gammaproteobacteria bacterium]|nr:rhomboid family intramembrane serine protease [Gammaproteobacteria bacterium]